MNHLSTNWHWKTDLSSSREECGLIEARVKDVDAKDVSGFLDVEGCGRL